jgi:very-short-patch-repair endonuclease
MWLHMVAHNARVVMDQRRRIHPETRARARELRRNQTPMERRLWRHLRRRQLGGLRFRRQHPIGRFIVDFYCAAHRLVVEVDGESHDYRVAYDEERTAWLEVRGYRVLRFSNRNVRDDLEGVVEHIRAFVEEGWE